MSDTTGFPRTLRIGILVFDGFEPIDVWGFTEAFSISRFIDTSYSSPPPYPFEVLLISNQRKPHGAEATPAPVKSANGPRVAPDYFRDQALEQKFDVLMIPGGIGTRTLVSDQHPEERQALIDWVRAMDSRVELMTSVCTGASVLAFSGLLDGKPATTNHAAFAWVTSLGPRVHWDNVSRWVDAGHYVTSA
jgi:putative intracellular protease/amidase